MYNEKEKGKKVQEKNITKYPEWCFHYETWKKMLTLLSLNYFVNINY